MNEGLKYGIQHDLQLRFLNPGDVDEIKKLCIDWFPIDYPESWFQDITNDKRFYSLAATHNTQIVGMIVAEVKLRSRMNLEDADILAATFHGPNQVAYILSLGVLRDYRRQGIASMLLDNLLSYLTSTDRLSCKAVYLHVLCTNCDAIRFYERRNFKKHGFLPYYYSIKNKANDGYSYVLYINGGRPPWTITDYLKQIGFAVSSLKPCSLPQTLLRGVQGLMSKIRMVAMGNEEVVNHNC